MSDFVKKIEKSTTIGKLSINELSDVCVDYYIYSGTDGQTQYCTNCPLIEGLVCRQESIHTMLTAVHNKLKRKLTITVYKSTYKLDKN